MLIEIAFDGGLEVDDGFEDAALEASPSEGGEEVLDGVKPGAGSAETITLTVWAMPADSHGRPRL